MELKQRNWILVLLLSVVTLGIYAIYLLYVMARDTNVACASDNKKTTGLLALLFFIITFGIYLIVWQVKIIKRWENYANNFGASPKLSIRLYVFLVVFPVVSFLVLPFLMLPSMFFMPIGSMIVSYILSGIDIVFSIVLYAKFIIAFNQCCELYNSGGKGNGGNSWLNNSKNEKKVETDPYYGWKF